MRGVEYQNVDGMSFKYCGYLLSVTLLLWLIGVVSTNLSVNLTTDYSDVHVHSFVC